MGFFTKDELKTDTHISLKTPQSCTGCGRYKNCVTPKMKPYGDFKKKIILLMESPSPQDDKLGTPLNGRQGRAIKKALKEAGINAEKDCLITHAVNCFTEERSPTHKEVLCCKSKVISMIKEHKPNVIIPVGEIALDSLIGHYWSKKIGSLQNWRGRQIPDRNYGAWICPVNAPWFIELAKEKYSGLAEKIGIQDLRAAGSLKEPAQNQDDTKYIYYVETQENFRAAIQEINKCRWISFDYETTGLKPHAPGHEIVCVSVAVSPTKVFVWKNTEYRAKVWAMILKKGKIKKSAHNSAFENLWSAVLLKVQVKGWYWCSMNTAHILDNRQGVCGLKYQTYINFGVIDYDSHISSYLESPAKQGANAKNKIKEFIKKFGIKPVLTYCALDSLYGYRLTEKQRNEIDNAAANELIPF